MGPFFILPNRRFLDTRSFWPTAIYQYTGFSCLVLVLDHFLVLKLVLSSFHCSHQHPSIRHLFATSISGLQTDKKTKQKKQKNKLTPPKKKKPTCMGVSTRKPSTSTLAMRASVIARYFSSLPAASTGRSVWGGEVVPKRCQFWGTRSVNGSILLLPNRFFFRYPVVLTLISRCICLLTSKAKLKLQFMKIHRISECFLLFFVWLTV